MNEIGPDSDLLQLMAEMTAAKQAVQEILKVSPEEIQLHRIHGMYTGHILFKILLWLAFTAFIVGAVIWIWHLLLPPSTHWLTPDQIDKIETILSTSVIAALFSKMAEKYF